jgi:hypothetical protein
MEKRSEHSGIGHKQTSTQRRAKCNDQSSANRWKEGVHLIDLYSQAFLGTLRNIACMHHFGDRRSHVKCDVVASRFHYAFVRGREEFSRARRALGLFLWGQWALTHLLDAVLCWPTICKHLYQLLLLFYFIIVIFPSNAIASPFFFRAISLYCPRMPLSSLIFIIKL